MAVARATASNSRLITGNKWLITLPVMIAALTAVLDGSIVNVAIPNMQSTFGASVDEIDWVITGYLISNVAIIPTTGWLSSLIGLRRYFIISQIFFIAGSVACGFSWNLGSLIFFRVLQGIGGGAIIPITLTLMLEAFPPEELPIASSLYGIGAALGPAIGPSLGGWLTDAASWPWIFFVNVPLVSTSIVLSYLFIGENREISRARASAPIDMPGLLSVVIWLSTMQVVLQQGQKDGWFESPFIVAFTVLSIASFVGFIFFELRSPHPLINIRIFANHNFALGSFTGAMLGAVLFGSLFILPLFAGTLLHYTALQIGLLLVPAALISLAGFALLGRVGTKIHPKVMMAIGIALFVASLFGNGFINLQSSFWSLAQLQMLRGAALPFLFTSVTALALADLAPRQKADGSSLFSLTRVLGGSIGIALVASTIVDRQKFHFDRFSESITQFGIAAQERLASLTAGFASHGSDPVTAAHQATGALSNTLTQQAYVGAFDDASISLAVAFALTFLLIPLYKSRPILPRP
jgi:MFS transporter, DHA2 family, multidrug resistance protein